MTPSNNPVKQVKAGWLTAAAAALVINLIMLSVLPVVNLGPLSLPRTPPVSSSVHVVNLAPPATVSPPIPYPREKEIPLPSSASPPEPAAVSLPPDYLDRALRPDLQSISVQADAPRLTDMPLATIAPGAAGLDGVFSSDQLDQPLTAVSRMPPFYPLGARRASIEGWVDIEFLVNTQGRVEDIRIIRAQPTGVFEDSVRKAVAGWRFQPGTVMGEPVSARVATTVRFELEDNP